MAEKHEHGGRHESGKKASQGGRGSSTQASPAAIQKYLKGMDYPASKKDLVQHAKGNDAPDDVMYVLNHIEEREYKSPTDVEHAVGELE